MSFENRNSNTSSLGIYAIGYWLVRMYKVHLTTEHAAMDWTMTNKVPMFKENDIQQECETKININQMSVFGKAFATAI